MSVLSVKNIQKSYKNNLAVKNVSFDIEKNDIYGVLGPNGAGKSTTINTIVGFLKPDSGSVTFEGKYGIKEWKRNIGYIPQELAIYTDLTAEENVSFFCSLYGFKGKELKERTENALVFTGLENERKKRASEFSGGMKRRLNIATAIAHTPKLVIMDEPTVGIDPQSRNHILESIKRLNAAGTTVLYTTHYMEEVEEICNKIIIIDHGEVITDGAKDEVKNVVAPMQTIRIETEAVKPFEAEKRLLNINGVKTVEINGKEIVCKCSKKQGIVQEIISVFTQLDINILNINCEQPTLEEVFLSVTGKELRDE